MATESLPEVTGTIIKTNRGNRVFEDAGTVGILGTDERERRWYETGEGESLSQAELQELVNGLGFTVLYSPKGRRPAFTRVPSNVPDEVIENPVRIVAEAAGYRAAQKLRADLQTINVVEEGTILKFTSVHETSGMRYRYAAVYAAGHWFVTGSPQSRFAGQKTHEQLMELFARHRKTVTDVAIAATFEEIL